jgi:hypothetical protein
MFAPRITKPHTKPAVSTTSRQAPQRPRLIPRRFCDGAVEQVYMLQRGIGNRAMLRLLSERARNLTESEPHGHNEREADPASLTTPGSAPGVSWDFSKIPTFPPSRTNRPQVLTSVTASPLPGGIQAKLAVGPVDDSLEREADRVADPTGGAPDSRVSIATAAPVGDGAIASQSLSVGDSSPSLTANAHNAPAVVNDALRGNGRPLDDPSGEFFGQRFGVDFAGVRVHSGDTAERSAAAVNARAYTVGQHIVLGAGAPSLATREGRRLLGHELTHVVQQARRGPLLQRQPRGRDAGDRAKVATKDPKPSLPQFVPADMVREVKRDNETWMMTVDGHTDPESLTRAMFPHIVPPGVTVTMKVAVTDPIERGWFVINGLTTTGLLVTEPSFAKLFADHGLEEDPPESDELRKAGTAFLNRHSDHSFDNLLNIIKALKRVTKRNPELLLAYYQHYSTHALTDESRWFDGIDFRPDLTGGTSRGDTRINAKVLDLTTKFPTDDPLSLLASTLIHEFVHTPQGGGDDPVNAAPKEAKAYGVEKFFSERMGDQTRANKISNMGWNSPLDVRTGADKIFSESYGTMKALYEVIDQGGPAAKEARAMTVEFISKNSGDYGQKLKEFIANHHR